MLSGLRKKVNRFTKKLNSLAKKVNKFSKKPQAAR